MSQMSRLRKDCQNRDEIQARFFVYVDERMSLKRITLKTNSVLNKGNVTMLHSYNVD